MRANRVGSVMLGLGIGIGVAGTAAWVLGFDPATLPPALLKIAAYKLTALAAIGLMAAGAVVNRAGLLAARNQAYPLSPPNLTELRAGDVVSTHDNADKERTRSTAHSVREPRR